ncbi:putative tail fibers protein [Salmonella phage SE4]|uniref:tail fiber protein n=1 Tax=Salmonella phage SE4 TaxID=2575328 RepID=UPI0011D2D6E7|nr:tail fiber protein [Salmonella phage SE4]QEG07778.1 putative tail fibers protein [Salmonella phage SE4]
MATDIDPDLQAQLDKLTIAVQLIHDFGMSDDPSIPNPEGGVIRTLEGINEAINEAIPNFEDANTAAIEARAARDAAQAAQTKAEQAAASASAASTSALYEFGAVASAATVTVPASAKTVVNLTLTSATTQINIGGVTDPATIARQITIAVKQGTGSNKANWDSRIKWANNRKPVLSFLVGYEDFVTLITRDSGNTWVGFFNGGWIG